MSKYLPFQLFIRQCLLYPLTSPFLPPPEKVEKDFSYAAGQKIGTLEGGGGFGTAKTGQTIVYEAGDDGTYQKGYPLVGDRFTDNGDGTITDNASGLMWPKDLKGAACNGGSSIGWIAGITFAEGLTFATHSDWRMANLKELISIMDYSLYGPPLNPIFIQAVTSSYWTSTAYKGNLDFRWGVWFTSGNCSNIHKAGNAYIMPVRDAA